MGNIIVFTIMIIIIIIEARKMHAKKRERERQAKAYLKSLYLESLASLKISPTNADRKQKTLTLGR